MKHKCHVGHCAAGTGSIVANSCSVSFKFYCDYDDYQMKKMSMFVVLA